MAIVQCPWGHFYDYEKYAVCPSCTDSGDEVRTVSLESLCRTEEVRLTARTPVNAPVRGNWDAEKTVALSQDMEPQLLVGWLVCTKGPMRGQDYRLYPGFNRIGRNMASDICVQDTKVSESFHCAVVYEERAGIFYLVPGKGTITYMDGIVVQQAEKLPEGTRFRLGESTLELVAFCKGEHVWKTI